MKRDTQIFDLIAAERSRQMHGIELIASENFVSDQVMEAMGSVLTNKYAEGYPGARYYGGCEVVDKVETLAIERICRLYGAEYANVQPHSGAQANMAVFFAVLKPGDTFMGLDLAHGGHLSHGSPVNMSGTYFKAIGYQLDPKPALYLSGHTDKDPRQKLKEQNIEKLRPRSYLFEWIVCVGFHEIKRDHREYDQCNDCCNELYLFFIFHLFHFITSNFSNSSSATKFCKKNVPKCFSVTTTRYILAHLFFN